MFFIFLVCNFNFGCCDDLTNSVPFSFEELTAQIEVNSPIQNKNFTYGSEVCIDVYVHIGGHEYEKGLHYIPYQNFSCVYSLDNGEWQNLTLISYNESPPFASIVNKWWHRVMDINCTATLQNVTAGPHFLTIAIQPDSILFLNESGSLSKPLVNFYVTDKPSTELNNALIIGSAFSIAALIVGALIYLKKLKPNQAISDS